MAAAATSLKKPEALPKLEVSSPYEQKQQDKESTKLIPTTLAYENPDFLRGNAGRLVRIICEFEEPGERLRAHNIKGTILFFGSARSMSQAHFDETVSGLRKDLAAATDAAKKQELQSKIERFEKVEWMCPYYVITENLSKKLTQWSMSQPKLKDFFAQQPDYLSGFTNATKPSDQPLVVCTGGGPGIMEAANRGATSVPGALSMGCGITLPFEKGLNPYVTPSLAFEYHYFFTRKFWMMLPAKALIVGPGGMGTADELFELLTLRQTGKLGDIPIVLLGKKFWQTVINWQALADFGTVSQAEVDKLFFTDDADEAFKYITSMIEDQATTFKAATVTPGPSSRAASSELPDGLFLGVAAHQAYPVSPALALARHDSSAM